LRLEILCRISISCGFILEETHMTDAPSLLRQYVEHGSESAFRELVTRYIDFVHSVALRRVDGDSQLAQDVAQTVFTDLARKASTFPGDVMLGGWLHRHTCFVSSSAIRQERRRHARERNAVEMNALQAPGDAEWQQIAPILDEAIDELGTDDRQAILLRFFEGCDLRTVGAALGASDDTAQKRVSRAVDKLRELLIHRGVTLTAAVLATALAGRAVTAAPVGLATTVSSAALVASASGAGLSAVILKMLAPFPVKLAVGALVATAVVAPLLLHHRDAGAVETTARTSLPSSIRLAPATAEGSASTAPVNTNRADTGASSTGPGVLHLTLLDADTGRPIPNGRIERHDTKGETFAANDLHTTSNGVCDVPFPDAATTRFYLITRVDGFADTRLHWELDYGESIPTNYVLRLVRPARIGGRVVDADGQPVAEARVRISSERDPSLTRQTEDHEFDWIDASTDAEGRWSVDRIAPDMIHQLRMYAQHPEHVDTPLVYSSYNPEAEKQLREGTYVFHLGRALSLRGIVVGPDGQPVAAAKILIGRRGFADHREATAAADGTFVVFGCKPGKTMVSAEGPGFAGTTLEAEVSADSEPVRVTLQHGRIVSFHVVDNTGSAVTNARVRLDSFPDDKPGLHHPQTPPSQADFSRGTDREGQMTWSNAPNVELTFLVTAPGYMRVGDVKVPPDEQEHVVTLPPSLVVTGTVRDAATGEPIPRFRVACGWPDSQHPDEPALASWSSIDRFRLNFSGGEFHHSFEEPVINGIPNPGYMLKVEADGYAPYTSRVIRPDEGEVPLDVQLHAANAMTVTVLLPDGRPAAGVDVGLVSPGARLQLDPGGFSHVNVQSVGALLATDADGHFSLPDDNTITRVVVAGTDGYAEVSPAALAGQPVIRLQPWGRLEGTYLVGGQPAANRKVLFGYGNGDFETVSLDYSGLLATTDADGRFVFPRVPPGWHILSHQYVRPDPVLGEALMSKFLTGVEIRSGETTNVTIGVGYAVTARLRWADDLSPATNGYVFGSVHTALPPAYEQAVKDPAASATLQQSPEFQEFTQKARSTQAVVTADGTVTAEGVPAGDYVLEITVMPEPAARQAGQRVFPRAKGQVSFTVPADPPSGTIDLGEIVVNKLDSTP
jgi:RNA polymerase sigma factor (sigma-70 family)